jgi:outer membrane receptor protein involved in Fe transport
MNPTASRLATLLGTASLVTLANAMTAQAQQVAQAQTAQAGPQEIPEQVLITGSLIHGAAAVGVPVTNLSPQDFAMTGSLTTSDLFRTVPAANVAPGPVATMSGANIERATRVNLRGLDTGTATRSLLMVDGLRVPGQGNGTCEIDPSIIPALSLDRIDVLLDGASATYGSDAVAGVINIVLKRAYDGAVTQARYTTAAGGKNRYQFSQLWGRTWDGGDVTLSYEWYDDSPIMGNAHSNFTVNFSPWGLDNRIPLASSAPGILSNGAPAPSNKVNAAIPGTFGTNCTNCFAIPAGGGVAFNPALNAGLGALTPGGGINWTSIAANTNTFANEFNPYTIAWYDAAAQRNGGSITVDQRLTKDITFYGEGFYSDRRAQYLNPANISPDSNADLSITIPTWNPYYPVGVPSTANSAGLRVNYNLSVENPSVTAAYEIADRYMGGFHIALPGDWTGDIYYSETYDSSQSNPSGIPNLNAVSAALGWTILPSLGSGTLPGLASWTKPGAVPYLNLLCDPHALQCNSPMTLGYVTGIRKITEKFWINEKGAKFDGPLFALPGGEIKAAVGATYTTSNFNIQTVDNTGAPSLLVPLQNETIVRHVWATFAQVNVPFFTDANKLPGIEKLVLEASWRHDQYSDFGGTSNPKVALDWSPIDWFTVRAAWGTNFRAPAVGETSRFANNAIAEQNGGPVVNAAIVVSCTPGAGSGAGRLVNPGSGLVGYVGGTCGTSLTPPGISMNGGAGPVLAAGWRDFVNQDARVLQPEQAMNWAFGGEFSPTTFLKGLDVQATWYRIKISSLLAGFGNPQSSTFNDPVRSFAYIVPTDMAYLHTYADVQCHNNNTPAAAAPGGALGSAPTGCPEFEKMVLAILADPRNTVPVSEQANIRWLNDGGTFNIGQQTTSGIDWNVSYDTDLGDYGAWNVGMVGTYYLHQYSQSLPGSPIVDAFHRDVDNGLLVTPGVVTTPRMHYRGRLGWSNGPWNVTGFVNYDSHFFHAQTAPPDANNRCTVAGGTVGGGTLPCLVTGYTNLEPSYYLFDLSLGYDTGDDPVNDYLKHVGIQVVVQNIMDKHPAFEYRIGTGGGNPSALDILKSDQGRTVSFILTKTW